MFLVTAPIDFCQRINSFLFTLQFQKYHRCSDIERFWVWDSLGCSGLERFWVWDNANYGLVFSIWKLLSRVWDTSNSGYSLFN